MRRLLGAAFRGAVVGHWLGVAHSPWPSASPQSRRVRPGARALRGHARSLNFRLAAALPVLSVWPPISTRVPRSLLEGFSSLAQDGLADGTDPCRTGVELDAGQVERLDQVIGGEVAGLQRHAVPRLQWAREPLPRPVRRRLVQQWPHGRIGRRFSRRGHLGGWCGTGGRRLAPLAPHAVTQGRARGRAGLATSGDPSPPPAVALALARGSPTALRAGRLLAVSRLTACRLPRRHRRAGAQLPGQESSSATTGRDRVGMLAAGVSAATIRGKSPAVRQAYPPRREADLAGQRGNGVAAEHRVRLVGLEFFVAGAAAYPGGSNAAKSGIAEFPRTRDAACSGVEDQGEQLADKGLACRQVRNVPPPGG